MLLSYVSEYSVFSILIHILHWSVFSISSSSFSSSSSSTSSTLFFFFFVFAMQLYRRWCHWCHCCHCNGWVSCYIIWSAVMVPNTLDIDSKRIFHQSMTVGEVLESAVEWPSKMMSALNVTKLISLMGGWGCDFHQFILLFLCHRFPFIFFSFLLLLSNSRSSIYILSSLSIVTMCLR